MGKLGIIFLVITSVVSIYLISTVTTSNILNPDEFEKLMENHKLKSRFGGPDKAKLTNKATEPSSEESTSTEELSTSEEENSTEKNFTLANRFLFDVPCNPPYRMVRGKCKKVYS